MSKKRYSSDNDFGILSMEESQVKCDNKKKEQTTRIIICGDSGIGKSALVNAFVSTKTVEKKQDTLSLEPIEVHGSNLCIVDTCGYGALLRAEVIFSHVKNYIEAQFEKTNQLFNSNSQDNDTLTYIINQASDALSHLDVCLYLIMGRIKPVDIEYMRSIHDLVNIIPVIIQPDLSLRPEMMIEQRIEVLTMMKQHDIKFSYLGYPDYNAIITACKHPQLNPYCPPFTLDWSSTKKSFHGLISLKQVLFQQQLRSLRYQTTLKFIQWRKQHQELSASTSSNSTQSSSSSIKNQNLNSIRISQYVSHRRHSMEKELLLQEKRLKQEFEDANTQKRTEIVLREIKRLMLQDNHHSLLKAIQQQQEQQQQQQQTTNPMILTPYWIPLSIIVSILVVYYQKGYLI